MAQTGETSVVDVAMNTSKSINSRQGCPCCSFAFDLFLPQSLQETTTNESLASTSSDDQDLPCSPQEALARIEAYMQKSAGNENGKLVLLVDTHGHAQLDRVRDEAYAVPEGLEDIGLSIRLKSLTCAVEPKDWQDTLDFASSSDSILPALGVHPWYVEDLPEDWLQTLEALLRKHPSAIVGEIGLCKMAKFVRQHPEGKAVALEIQRSIFKEQMILAAKLRRPVSVHCVNQHGTFVSVLKEIVCSNREYPRDALPVTIGMHSFTGTANHVKELLTFEKSISPQKPLFYFGFSHAVNYAMCTSDKSRRKGREAVRAVPSDRILVESDVHSPSDLRGGTAGAIAYAAWATNTSVEEMAEATSRNGLTFLGSGAYELETAPAII
jgi:Tat protein secretion system quality control protein TatD with DNase activity